MLTTMTEQDWTIVLQVFEVSRSFLQVACLTITSKGGFRRRVRMFEQRSPTYT